MMTKIIPFSYTLLFKRETLKGLSSEQISIPTFMLSKSLDWFQNISESYIKESSSYILVNTTVMTMSSVSDLTVSIHNRCKVQNS